MKLIFCIQINIKVSYKLISKLWASKMPTRWYYHYCWAWSSILKVLKVISLQYIYNISKKKLGREFIFCMQMNIKVSTSWDRCFDGSGQICPKYPKQEIGNIFAKSVVAALCSILMEDIQIFCRCPAMFIVTCFLAQSDCRNFLPEHCNTIIKH